MIITGDPYIAGKMARLAGKPLSPPKALSNIVAYYDWRMGWRVADGNRRKYPDWTDAFILGTPEAVEGSVDRPSI